jgi:hypothetical protein
MPVLALPVGKYDTSPPLGTSANAGEAGELDTSCGCCLKRKSMEDGVIRIALWYY